MDMNIFNTYKKVFKIKHLVNLYIDKDIIKNFLEKEERRSLFYDYYSILIKHVEKMTHKYLYENFILDLEPILYDDKNINTISFLGDIIIYAHTNWLNLQNNFENMFEKNCMVIIIFEEIIEELKKDNKIERGFVSIIK